MPGTADTRTVETSIVIARSPQDVYDYATDIERLPEWRADIVDAGLDTPGPQRVGSRGWDAARIMGRVRRFDWEVTDAVPGKSYGVRGTTGPVRVNVVFGFAPQDRGTRVDYRLWFTGHGPVGIMRHLLIRRIEAERDTILVPLKHHLEA
ncbi:SRPBCC family protein [Knoellia subterranea]|uniref:Polyketide cyclase n=1 Tax=Knoellia subterranea KCTC 19937 TaxID=1385521 RepID=A0A0A0JL32_9MICO|nr:SRPBCC family protein [Knoellia subterranea]KGN37449.1 hypothetical protein N803_13735 [Knoellia subterranea KCTC 19937]